ncbi:MAG: CHAT domain-containing protein [Bacteroidales bacterium]|nr:CHAT domain-containing protein [Bacteroidales bacterium]
MKLIISLLLLLLFFPKTANAQTFEQVFSRAKELYDSAQWRKADTVLAHCRQIARNQFGKYSLEYANVLSLSGELAWKLDQKFEADSLLTLSLDIFNINKDNISPLYIKTLSRHALYTDFNVKQCLLAVELSQIQFGDNSIEYADALDYLGKCYVEIQEFNKALDVLLIALKIKKQLFGENNIQCATTMISISDCYYDLFNPTEKMYYDQKVAEIIKNSIGENNPIYAYVLGTLALSYDLIGNYEKEIELFEQSLRIYRETLGETYSGYLITLNNYSFVYSDNGDIKKAIQILNEISEEFLKLFGYNNIDYATSLINLGCRYGDLKNYNKAIEYLQECYEIYKIILETKSNDYANCLYKLGFYNSKNNNRRKSIHYYKKSSKLYKKNQGKENAVYLKTIGGLALVSNINKRIKILKNVIDLSSKIYNTNNSQFQSYNFNLGKAYFQKKQYSMSVDYLSTALDINNKRLSDNFAFMSSDMKEHYWNINQEEYPYIRKLVFQIPKNTKVLCSAYDGELINKGVLMTSELQIEKIIKNSSDSLLIKQYEEINKLKRLFSLYNAEEENKHSKERDSLRDVLEKLERNLSINCREYGDITRPLKIRWHEVKDSLKDNEVAIEFIKEPLLKSKTDTIASYGALILSKAMPYPVFVSLFREDQFNKIFNDLHYFSKLNDTILYSMIWRPIEKYLKPNNKIYFAPVGVLTQTPIEFAFLDSTKTISDIYDIYRVSSTRNIAMGKKHIDLTDAIVYGGINYDTDTTIMKNNKKNYNYENQYKYRANFILYDSVYVNYLSSSEIEANNIANILDSSNISYIKLCNNNASEESFKALNGNSKNIIHIATHGFYLPTNSKINNNEDALLFSGLLFSGCNNILQKKTIPEGVEDGILLSKEISQLDLSKTDLVVLSACKTGVGVTDYEGVFGLQRGFIKAGVNTLIMSLWDVDDYATLLLMTEFYKQLSQGKNKHDAFIQAVRYLHNYPDSRPEYWSAFIMLD